MSSDALDLLDRMLLYDHAQRGTAQELMQHPYFAGVRAAEDVRRREEEQAAGQGPGGAANGEGAGAGGQAAVYFAGEDGEVEVQRLS